MDIDDTSSQTETVKLLIFSNILDIEQVNLNNLAILIKNSQKGANYFICVSPNFSTAKQRIEKFSCIMSQLFQVSNISIDGDSIMGRLWITKAGGFVNKPVYRYQRIFMPYAI